MKWNCHQFLKTLFLIILLVHNIEDVYIIIVPMTSQCSDKYYQSIYQVVT